MAPTTIAVINEKGGSAKSSSCFHLAGALAELEQRVLLIDADPQASLSRAFFGAAAVEQLPPEETTTALFQGAVTCNGRNLIAPTQYESIWVVRANHTLSPYNLPTPETAGMQQFALASFIESIPSDQFDIILIDCPPNLYLCSWNALLGANHALVPVPPEDFGAQGLRAVHQAIGEAAKLNTRLKLLGHVVTRSDRRLLVHQAYLQKLRRIYGDSVFETVVPEATAFKVALACRETVISRTPTSVAAQKTRELALEILARIQQRAINQEVA